MIRLFAVIQLKTGATYTNTTVSPTSDNSDDNIKCGAKKLAPSYFCNNFVKVSSIWIILGKQIYLNPLVATLKPQSKWKFLKRTIQWLVTLAVDGWAVTFGTARMGLGWAAVRPGSSAVPNVTAHPSTASVPISYYSMWHYNCLWSLKG